MPATLSDIAAELDVMLRVAEIPDYPPALNGTQVQHRGPVRRVAAAVDASLRTIHAAIAADANLLLVHHGLFWSGPTRLTGRHFERLSQLIQHDVAVYAAHLPLDVHETHGNSRLLAAELALECRGGFARYEQVHCGVWGDASVRTAELHARLRAFSQRHGGDARATPYAGERTTHRWAICTGSGATRDTLDEAAILGVDTLIVGEGPHWTAVDAEERGLVILYGGHYATETLGVCSVAAHVERTFGVPWTFVEAPTGL